MIDIARIALFGDPAKLVEFPEDQMLKMAIKADSYRFYMFDPDNMLIMIVPELDRQTFHNAFVPLVSENYIDDDEKASDIKEIAQFKRHQIRLRNDEGYLEVKDVFEIYLFAGNRLWKRTSVDTTTAVHLALSLAHLNAFDPLGDNRELDGLLKEAEDELKEDGY